MRFNLDVIQLLQSHLDNEGWIDLPSSGDSMYPLIQQGDVCRFVPVEGEALKKGDIVLFWASSSQLVAHRFHYQYVESHVSRFVFKGDSNLGYDPAIAGDRILGKLQYIKRNRRIIYPEAVGTMIWAKLILSVPTLSKMIRVYLNRRRVSYE